jgi:single-stranded-DNA-specific exonuclease
MDLRWTLRPHDAQLVEDIERNCQISPVLAQILALRGITGTSDVASFLEMKMTELRDPSELPGITEATEIIYSAVTDRKKIFIYGDYDCDGMTSTAILVRCLKLLDADVRYFVPSRLDDGYGLNNDSLKKLHDRGAELIVTVDCGVASVGEVAFAKQLGMQVVVTDHHHPGAELPAADAIVHPALPGSSYPFAGLCGAGVAFKLAWSLLTCHHGSPKLPEPLREFLISALSLAAIGTVADVVPLLDENRIIVRNGLEYLRRFANPGLRHLIQVSKSADKPKLDSEDIAFGIAPRLNASGRLGQAQLGVELLITEDEQRAEELAKYIDELNKNRDTLDRRILKEAKQIINDHHDPENEPAIVLAAPDWHLGVIGIVAGRIAGMYHRPTIIISTDPLEGRAGVGSCRTSCGVNLYDALSGCGEHLVGFGGHAAAAGLSIKNDEIDAFRETFFEQVIEQVCLEELLPDLDIDAETSIGLLTLQTMNELEKLAPFGQNNPRPVLCVSGVKLAEAVKTMGSDGRHLSMQLLQHESKIRAVAFGKSDWLPELEDIERLYDFAFRPVINEFRGYRSVELHLLDFRPTKTSVVS